MDLTAYSSQYICLTSKFPKYFKSFSLTLLLILVGVDLVFMGLHALKSLGYISDPNLSVTQNWGYAESFQYIKSLLLSGIFIWLGVKYGKPLFYCWAAVFLYILIDDSLEIHEHLGYKLGDFITNNFEIGAGGTSGEILVFGAFGLLIFIPLFYFYYRSMNRDLKIMSQDLFMLFTAMLFFGIGVDLLHDFAETGTVINGMLGLIEDGGEMLVLSVTVWYQWTFVKNDNFFKKETGLPQRKAEAITVNLHDRTAAASNLNKLNSQKKKKLKKASIKKGA